MDKSGHRFVGLLFVMDGIPSQDFGLMHVRVQSWFPFTVSVCLNGRNWLARQMDRAGIDYRQCENCFLKLSDPVAAQALMNQQLQTDWPKVLGQLLKEAQRKRPLLGSSR